MNLQHLRHLVAIADTGSLREAAKSLNLSQSAMTKSLKVLEQHLGVPLVDRGSQGSVLTSFGREVVAHGRLVGAEIDSLERRLLELTGRTAGVLRIGTAAAASLEILSDTISVFRARYPKSEIFVDAGLPIKLLPRLLDGSIDVIVGPRNGVNLPPSVQATSLYFSESVIVVRKGHPLQAARSLREFSDVGWVLTTELSMPDSCLGIARARLKMPPPNIVLRTDEPFLSERLVSCSDHATVLRRCFFQSPLSTNRVVAVDLTEVDLFDDIVIFTRKTGHTPLMAERFAEILRTHASDKRTRGTDTPAHLRTHRRVSNCG